jgi:chorismate lyase/3-hydroxybenzoate synthase
LRRPELTDVQSSHGPSGHGTPDEEASKDLSRSARLCVDYLSAADATPLPGSLLAAIHFGTAGTSAQAAPVSIHVRLESADAVTECWHADGPVTHGQAGSIRYASDAHRLFAVCELDEREHGGVRIAAEKIYADLQRFQQQSGFPHLLRIWNYMDAINAGEGDEERYRQFCVGRLRGLGDAATESHFPAASALGHQHGTRRLQVYWLAGRVPGVHIENPRQVSAYRYPRTHGPVSPSFARATLVRDGTLLVSGTASIVGHLSRHAGEPLAQLDEIVRNLASLGVDGNGPCLLKTYVRDPVHRDAIAERLHAAFPRCPSLFLAVPRCGHLPPRAAAGNRGAAPLLMEKSRRGAFFRQQLRCRRQKAWFLPTTSRQIP